MAEGYAGEMPAWTDSMSTDEYTQEMGRVKERTLIQQRAKVDTWIALNLEGLPVPPDLEAEITNCAQFDVIMERLAKEESQDG